MHTNADFFYYLIFDFFSLSHQQLLALRHLNLMLWIVKIILKLCRVWDILEHCIINLRWWSWKYESAIFCLDCKFQCSKNSSIVLYIYIFFFGVWGGGGGGGGGGDVWNFTYFRNIFCNVTNSSGGTTSNILYIL